MYQIVYLKGAIHDLKDAAAWYEIQQKGLSKRFLKEVFATIDIIKSNPFLYQIRHDKNYRFAKVNKFPYLVVFEIEGENILINYIFHTSKEPK